LSHEIADCRLPVADQAETQKMFSLLNRKPQTANRKSTGLHAH
jgi:hypothetical protein